MVPAFIGRRRFERGIMVRRICNFAIRAISVSEKNQVCGLISSCTTRINLPVLLLYRRHAARFDMSRAHRATRRPSRLPTVPLAYAVEES